MPTNEIDSIWFGKENKIYYGHIFLIHIHKIRLLAKLSGFKIKRILPTRVNYTALFLFLFLYPFIAFISIAGYFRAIKKSRIPSHIAVYKEILALNLNINVLIGNHLFIEFEKQTPVNEVVSELKLGFNKHIHNT